MTLKLVANVEDDYQGLHSSGNRECVPAYTKSVC